MYQIPKKEIWKGRVNPDPGDKQWHQVIEMLDMTNDIWQPAADRAIALIGFCSDEGVRRNFGRVGAKDGPDAIRSDLARLAVHHDPNQLAIVDAGNVLCSGKHLEKAFQLLAGKILDLLNAGYFPMVLGGGHETAYPHFCAIDHHFDHQNDIGIINFDAHFDMRTYATGPHSGSPFRNVLNDLKKADRNLHYLPIGIDPSVNVKSLFDVMDEHDQGFILQDDVNGLPYADLNHIVNKFIDKVDHVYVTIDMDCFPVAYAPGVSATNPIGILPQTVKRLLADILSSGKVVSLDVVEVNPKFDDGRTSKLAASLINEAAVYLA
ncbi:MAG: formimidoylglutamase [Cyclobacteriaceae bacterium]